MPVFSLSDKFPTNSFAGNFIKAVILSSIVLFNVLTCFCCVLISVLLTGPPSAVVNLTVAYKDQSSIKVIWSRPLDLGGRTDLSYSVDCVGCDHKVKFTPRQTGFHSTRFDVYLHIDLDL